MRIWHPHDSGFIAYSKISTLESGTQKVADSHTGYVGTEAESAKKKLGLQNIDPDSCGRGLRVPTRGTSTSWSRGYINN